MDFDFSYLVYGLILTPIIAAVVMLFIKQKNYTIRKVCVYAFAVIIAIGSIVLVFGNLGNPFAEVKLPEQLSSEIVSYVFAGVGIVCSLVVLAYGIKHKNIIAIILAAVQLVGSAFFEFAIAPGCPESEMTPLYYDYLSLIMVFIIGVIGSGICVYALGYMKDFNAHLKEGEEDRTNKFFALLFVFLSAMFVIVLSDNMTWMFAGWEVTTLCSFLLIGYTKTDEAIKNSFRQINMNMLGGIAFLAALFFCVTQLETTSLATFLSKATTATTLLAVPCCLLAFAGMTKAAQMPFHTWLLGAMVAPTPTSALLHSSTMVKAGVFMLIKLSPAFLISSSSQSMLVVQIMVMLVGGVTFLFCSVMAITQSNAKRVLAYSTIANLGLIVACAGVGTPEAIWAAIFLLIFHAAAKSLLFLCVGTAEHHIGSRDIEDMDGLFTRMPKLARFMMVGMMAMFIAPFGMLISKWGALVSFTTTNQIVLVLILAFGSAATFMFWAKWLGKLSAIVANNKNIEKTVHKSEWISQIIMLGLVVLFVVALPVISAIFVAPYIQLAYVGVFGQYYAYAILQSSAFILPTDTLFMCIISTIIVLLVLFVGVGKRNKNKQADVYLAGAGINSDKRIYKGSMENTVVATSRNMYFTPKDPTQANSIVEENMLSMLGSFLNCIIFIGAAIFIALFSAGLLVL